MHTTVTEGYVLVTPANTFIGTGRVSTMVGYRPSVHVTDKLELATVFTGHTERDMRNAIDDKYPGTRRLPVTVTRTVAIVTEQLNFSLDAQ